MSQTSTKEAELRNVESIHAPEEEIIVALRATGQSPDPSSKEDRTEDLMPQERYRESLRDFLALGKLEREQFTQRQKVREWLKANDFEQHKDGIHPTFLGQRETLRIRPRRTSEARRTPSCRLATLRIFLAFLTIFAMLLVLILKFLQDIADTKEFLQNSVPIKEFQRI